MTLVRVLYFELASTSPVTLLTYLPRQSMSTDSESFGIVQYSPRDLDFYQAGELLPSTKASAVHVD